MSSECKLNFDECIIDLWSESLEGGLPDMTMHVLKPFTLVHLHPNELRKLFDELKILFDED